jgi:transposase-like protein
MERKSNIWRNNQELLTEIIHPPCIYCNSGNVYKDGLKSKKQYKCQDCHKMFITERKRKIKIILNDLIVSEIRSLWNSGNYSKHKLCELFCASLTTIHNIVENKIWDNK